MKNEKAESNLNDDLRHHAEERLKDCRSELAGSTKDDSKDALALVHELQVHQIELEMQNEELKRAKLETEEALTKYSDLYDFAPIGLFTLDAQGLIQEVNLVGASLLGVERRNLMNRHFWLFVAPKDRPYFDEFCKSAFETGIKQMCELNLLRDGEPTVHARVDGIAAEDGLLKGNTVRIAVIDITERKRLEKELHEARDYLETLINYANAPIIVWDASFRIARFNHAFERLTGLRAPEALGAHLNILFPESSREESIDLIGRTLSGERWEAVEIPVLHTDGSVRIVLWNSANIYDKDGTTIVSTIAQGQDITERKHAEEELKKARNDLELRVQERTAELQNSLEAAEESVRAKAAFMANMSHELRTPMNAVIGFSSLLLDDDLTREHREYIEAIRKGGEAQLAIIDDILDYSRAERDKVELEHQPFSLKHLIDESFEMVATQASKRGLNLSHTINYGTPDTIIGDHGRLRQILVNLLSNSVKFTDKGDVSVSVSSKSVDGDRHQIFFAVKDTGIGIPQDKMNQLFQPFTQLERTLSRKRDGVGLGLAITKNLVELMGGKIWAESTPQGTVFNFTIQAETIPGKQLDFGRMDSGIAPESLSGLKPMRILVAEDNPSNQRVLVEMLKRLGYRADAVADGKEVVQALERQDYDLVLMDVKMPEMDGITATQVIRKLRPENGPKIVAITAFALEGDREKCLEAGMDDYISKPIQLKELAAILKKYSGE
jgi:PAS domain S-box-containing protein